MSRIQAALGFGSSRRSGREACSTLQPSLDVLPSVTSGTNRFLPWGPWGGTSWGCCILATFLASFLPRGPEASSQPHPEGLASRSQAAQEGSRPVEAPWGMAVAPPGVASTGVFETSPYLPGQSMLLVPVPTGPHPPWHLPADLMGEAMGKLSGRKLVVPGDGTGIYPTAPFFLPRMHKLSCLIYFLFFSDRVALCT